MNTESQALGLITPDFTQVQDRVAEGIYKCRIVDAKVDKWEGKTNPQTGERGADIRFVNWRMETFGELEDKNNGRSIFHRTAVEGAGAFRFQDLYKAAMGEDCVGAFDPTMLYGRELEVTYGPQKNKPEYMEVKSVRPLNH